MFDDLERDITTIRLSKWGSVSESHGPSVWLVYDDAEKPVSAIREFLIDFVAQGNSSSSVRSYAYALLRWWRWLRAIGVEWNKATPAEGRDLVLWLLAAEKERNHRRTKSASTAGTINPVTRKRYLDDNYAARTIRHSNAVIGT
ncbi:site-specific integrase [Mycobacteroides abscessus]|uniref:site-specific integrase n=1 Tax=Mycobacteroides abscessus TaxID=36809 RepID=UPI0009A84C94|nr:site-specific integrase [Mycobacteroides abscessus]SLJ76360.1 phage integrase family protein [Mycobacteroides abscessus subsp. abscessus]SLJ80731.1 phage integrase family protein [Mycobacteroides abscessus subsp. abscessus]